MSELQDIKSRLQARAESLVRELAPDGYRAGRYWMAKNPARADDHAGSFWVALKGNAIGAWRDEATGDKGDIIGLVQHCQGLRLGEALDWARGWLGLGSYGSATAPPTASPAAARKVPPELLDDDERLAGDRRRALGLWLSCGQIDATIAATYLLKRGIDLGDLARPARALRFNPACRHIESGRDWPAIVACMTGPDGKLWAIHRTFLDPVSAGKAPVRPARKIWPSFRGAAIRIARGETNMSPEAAAAAGKIDRLALCEGVEDGLSLALACPELRVWAVGSLGNLASIAVPECCAEVIVAADNDWGKPQAERQLARAIEALVAQRRPVGIARSLMGKDVNDALRGETAA